VGLAGRVGVDETRGAAVAGHAGAADDGVDPVAVTLGVGEALEDDDSRALADQDAVGVAVEGADALARGERAQLGEHAPQRDVVAVVDAPGEHQVAAPGGEFGHRLVDGDQRGRAGRVHRVRRAAQVEAVGDAGRREVGDQADDRLWAVGAEPVGERGADAVELAGVQVGQQLAQGADELARRTDPLVEPDQAGGEVAAPAEHDTDAPPVGQPGLAARVGEGGGGHVEGDELVGFGAGHRVRHDAEPGDLDLGQLVHETTAPAVHLVGHGRTARGVRPVVVRVPTPVRHLADGVRAAQQIPPVRVEVGGAGEQHRHAHDGDRHLTVRHGYQPEAV
jgi:hypothetical protein